MIINQRILGVLKMKIEVLCKFPGHVEEISLHLHLCWKQCSASFWGLLSIISSLFIYIYTYIHTYIHTYVFIYIYICIRICLYVYVYIYIFILMYWWCSHDIPTSFSHVSTFQAGVPFSGWADHSEAPVMLAGFLGVFMVKFNRHR